MIRGAAQSAGVGIDKQHSFKAAIAVKKLLRGAEGSLMQFLRTLLQAKANAELFVQRFFVVAHDIQAAALSGPLWPKGTDDNVPSQPNRGSNLPNVGGAVLRHSQEVKHCAVVPDVVGVWRQTNLRDIADEPRYALSRRAQPFLGHRNGGFGNVQDGDAVVAAREEIVDERGFASSDVNDGC
jgi:hypothetical protein